MGVIRRFYELMQSLMWPILSPVQSAQIRAKHQWKRRQPYSVVTGLLMGSLCIPALAWSGNFSGVNQGEHQDILIAKPVKQTSPRSIVAAGFGFQNADSSTITVKTYDALTGEILSDESYDLSVKEEDTSSSRQPRERIFAGGVGVGADGLSDFTLRVYDAATGRFLWEGRLNLAVNDDGGGATYRVVAHLRPNPSLRTVQQVERVNGQPSFLLRAIDPATGQLVWADQFSASHGTVPKIERIAAGLAGLPLVPAARSKNFDFRIQMFDDQNRKLLWEDAIVPNDETESLSLGRESKPERLPAWAKDQNETRKDTTRFEELLRSTDRLIRTAPL